MSMQEAVNRLIDLKQTAWESAKTLREQAIEENRDLSPEEEEQWQRANADIDAANSRLKEIDELEQRAKIADEFREKAGPILGKSTAQSTPSDGQMLRAIFLGHAPGQTFYGSSVEEQRAIVTSTNTVAALFADRVAVYQRTLNPTYALATVLRTNTGGPLTVPRLTGDLTAYVPGEGTAITESTPTLSSIVLNAFGYKALSYWSAEMDEDDAVAIEDLIARSAARQIALDAGSDFTIGTDTVEPNGFITAGSNGGTAAGSPFFAATDLMSLFYSLAAPYRASDGAAWQVSNSALQKMRKFVDTAGQFLWDPSISNGTPDRFNGRAVHENPHMAAVASASKSVAFGDFSAYMVREVNGLRVDRSSDFRFNTDEIALKTVWRVDGDLPDVAAIKFLVSATA